jgi:hypothetical protein
MCDRWQAIHTNILLRRRAPTVLLLIRLLPPATNVDECDMGATSAGSNNI